MMLRTAVVSGAVGFSMAFMPVPGIIVPRTRIVVSGAVGPIAIQACTHRSCRMHDHADPATMHTIKEASSSD